MDNVVTFRGRPTPPPPAQRQREPRLRPIGVSRGDLIATYHLEERLVQVDGDDWAPWTVVAVRDRCLATMRASETTDTRYGELFSRVANDD